MSGWLVLHMVDYATRFSVASALKSKHSSEIVRIANVMQYWISYFGAPRTFLTDNGRKFNNEEFREMAQSFNIVVKNTPAQSPLSNGLNDRHNALLGDMVMKVIEDNHSCVEVALA